MNLFEGCTNQEDRIRALRACHDGEQVGEREAYAWELQEDLPLGRAAK